MPRPSSRPSSPPAASSPPPSSWAPLPLAILLAVGIVILAPTRDSDLDAVAHAEGTIQTLLGDDEGLIPETLVPTARPRWIDGDPLTVIAALLARGEGSEARTMLLRFLDERDGQLIAPPGMPAGSTAIPAPWRVLRDWFVTLPEESRNALRFPDELAARTFATGTFATGTFATGTSATGTSATGTSATGTSAMGKIDAASPLVWLEGLDAIAERRLLEAVEAGDAATARLLLHRPRLADRIHPVLLEWIATADPAESVPPLPRLPAPRATATEKSTIALETEVRIPLDLAANPTDHGETLPHPIHRRIPLADLRPAISAGIAVLPGQRGVFGLELSPPYDVLWTLAQPYPDPRASRESLRDTAWAAALAGDRLVLPLRTPRVEHRSTSQMIYEEHDWRERGWNAAGLLRWNRTATTPLLLPTPDWALEGFTVGGVPLVADGRVHWLATRGFVEVETWVLTCDLETGIELWRRPLTVRRLPWQATADLSDLLPAGRLVAHRDECFVISRGGLIARLGRQSGDLRGLLLVPRHLRTAKLGRLARIRTGSTEALRLRPTCDAWVVTDPAGGERLVALPPDGSRIVAVDLESWTIAWAQANPARQHATLHRGEGGTPWVIDLTTAVGENTVRAWSLDPVTGRIGNSGPVDLEVPGKKRRRARRTRSIAPSPEDFAPIVSGNPFLIEGGIAIPTRRGLAVWSRAPLSGGTPERLIAWPEGSVGGTIAFIDEESGGQSMPRVVVLHRQETVWGTTSTAEVMRFVASPQEN